MDVNVVDTDENLEPVTYICSECGKDVVLQPVAAVRCRNCGSRILYKNRSHKVVQYEAR
ncbi:transcription activator, putative [Babesia microti strain RI]|uniref:Transcription activator, putative n=1 Tax=Babesia microti (strain RI) TaxID=1133968 RepID=A0A1N6LY73_BABMR|nr:transcription activator, putative [Babesia microti strain RI]SIO73823.1 transcription activator, putative [Babesia microti strain RI]|eukprot:XP_021337880.1 transcription activator, putative [Babesia microti strain RI]